tara:strand:- start:1563 stop:2198 length:636 start_codon:yes stop_codon:yes gene_type:complete
MKELEKAVKFTRSGSKDAQFKSYNKMINTPPPSSLLLKNPSFGNKYIPVETLEQMFVAIYLAHQIVIPFPQVLVEGQILTVVDLKLYHPVLNQWLTFSGSSCVPLISAEKDFKYNHKNIPAGKSYAIINAAKEIGPLFRAEGHNYSKVMSAYFDQTDESVRVLDPAIERMKLLIKTKKTKASLQLVFVAIGKLDNQELLDLYKVKYKSLKK